MTKVLGFDIGVASIGWAYIEKDGKGKGRIIKSGVRIVPSNKDEQSVFADFADGKPASFSKDRRSKRGIRRNVFRRKLRKARLKALLQSAGMFNGLVQADHEHLGIWELRALATQEQLGLEEIGRVLLHLNNRRGFKSNRKSVSSEESDSNWLKAVSENSSLISKQGVTVGALHYAHLKNDTSYSTRNRIFKRADYEKEFDAIWETQMKFYPDALTDDLKLRIGDYTIFYQRPLKSAKHLLSTCRYEKHHKVIPKSSPLFQYFRGFEKVLNLRITNQLGTERVLSNSELELLLLKLSSKKELDKFANLTEARIKKIFNLGKEYDVNYEKIEGNRTLLAIQDALENNGVPAEQWLAFDPLADGTNQYDKQPLFQLWHALYSIENEADLRKTLSAKFGFDLETTRDLMAIKLESDYGALSSRAIRKILKEFKNFPENASHGVKAAGYEHSDSETLDERAKRELLDKLTHIPKGKLRNPVVEKVLNQLISVMNAILEHPELGRPDEIRVELARELKSSAKNRKRMEEGMRKANRENDSIRELLTNEFGIRKPTRRDITRYRSWIDQGQQCLYSGEPIPRNLLFAGEHYELDHIIPRARMFNDSRANLVLVKSQENKEKGDRTALDFMISKGPKQHEQYLSRVAGLYDDGKFRKGLSRGIGMAKRDFLLMATKDIPQDFIDRQLRESQYIVKEALGILKGVCRNVTSTTGSITDLLRHHWGVDSIFHQIQVAKYRQWGKTYIENEDERTKGQEKIENWTKRLDHRHHAMDAIVVACTTQSFIQRLNNLSKFYDDDYEGLKTTLKKFGDPWDGFHQDVRRSLESIVISFRNRRRVATKSRNLIKKGSSTIRQTTLTPRGPLHLDTVYAKRLIDHGTRVKLDKRFTIDQLNLIINPAIREVVQNHLSKFDDKIELAFKDLKKTPLLFKEEPLVDVHVYDSVFTTKVKPNPKFLAFEKIVGKDVREAMKSHLAKYGNDPATAFADLEKKPIWFNEQAGIRVKKFTVLARPNELTALRTNELGETIDYVDLKNNHHMAIYRTTEGKYTEDVVSFWEAFERIKNGESALRKINTKGFELVLSLMINDYVLIDTPSDINLDITRPLELSQYLYRVQSISSGDVFFRHHHESTLDNKEAMIRITSLEQLASRLIKIRATLLGDLIV